MKRFYKIVSVRSESAGHTVLLDGRPVMTPARRPLLAPTSAIAEAVLQEWAGQGEIIVPDTMPVTQILSTKIDRVEQERAAMTCNLLKYIDTDLLCYRAETPEDLAHEQAACWDSWLGWFKKKFGVTLSTTTGLGALRQPENAHEKLGAFIDALDNDRFTVLQIVTVLSGSLVLALAFIEGAVSPGAVFEACHIEENYKDRLYNAEKYGPDPLQHKKDLAAMRDLVAAAQFIMSLKI